MAYTQKSKKQDIRSLPFKSLPRAEEGPSTAPTSIHTHRTELNLNPARDIRRIIWCSIPLILVLALANYMDSSYHWVIPFSERLLKLGS